MRTGEIWLYFPVCVSLTSLKFNARFRKLCSSRNTCAQGFCVQKNFYSPQMGGTTKTFITIWFPKPSRYQKASMIIIKEIVESNLNPQGIMVPRQERSNLDLALGLNWIVNTYGIQEARVSNPDLCNHFSSKYYLY